MAKLCIFVPGLFGSRFDTIRFGFRVVVWVDNLQLATGAFTWLALSADGVTPARADFPVMIPAGGLKPYYDQVQSTFAGQLAAAGYELQMYGIDWRQSILRTGSGLAARIQSIEGQYDEIVLIGHSMGGNVCRRAWQVLAGFPAMAKIRRVITIGTPHAGSWEPAAAFAQASDYIPELVLIVSNVISPPGIPLAQTTLNAVLQIMATWPSLYELLPVVSAADLTSPFVEALYTASSWPASWGIQQRWLDHSRTTYRAFALDPTSFPPSEVLTTVAGTDYPTATGWQTVAEIGTKAGLRSDGIGDGVVLQSSALVPSATQYVVSGSHQQLADQVAGSGALIRMVLEAGTPTPPPVVALPGAGGVLLRGPPLALTGIWGIDP